MPERPTHDQLARICQELEEELRHLVAAQASGDITAEIFVAVLLNFETGRAAAHSLTLTATHTFDDWTIVCLRLPGCSEPCASFEFLPTTGCFRPVGTSCRPAEPVPRERADD